MNRPPEPYPLKGEGRGPGVGAAIVRAELAGISPAGVLRQRSRVRPGRTGLAQITIVHAVVDLESPHALPAPEGVLPSGAALPRLAACGHIQSGTATLLPARWGQRSPFRLDPEGHSGVPRGRIGARRSDRRLSPSLGDRRANAGSSGLGWSSGGAPRKPVPSATAVGWFGSPDRACHLRGREHLAVPRTPYLVGAGPPGRAVTPESRRW